MKNPDNAPNFISFESYHELFIINKTTSTTVVIIVDDQLLENDGRSVTCRWKTSSRIIEKISIPLASCLSIERVPEY